MSRLTDHAHRAAYKGDEEAARYVLRAHADRKGWADETFRARWDGASALLSWWRTLDPISRPPLGMLDTDDARAFLEHLEAQGLACSTVRGYRTGARVLTRALHDLDDSRKKGEVYDAFKGVTIGPPKRVYELDPKRLAQQKPTVAAKLDLLIALLNLGMSVPEVCSRRRSDLALERRWLYGYKQRIVKLGARAVAAATTLINVTPPVRCHGWTRLLGWNADTARRHLRQVGMMVR